MLKVLFITRKWPPAIGGMETYSVQITNELSGVTELEVLKLPGRKNGKPPSILELFVFVTKCAWRLFTGNPVNIVHVGDLVLWPLAWAAQIAQPKARNIVTVYGLDIVYGNRIGLIARLYKLYLQLGLILCGRKLVVLAISRATAELCHMVGLTNINVVPLGVKIPEINKKVHYDAPSNFVLYVGRLVKRKGLGWFVNEVLTKLESDIKLVVVGKAWDSSEMEPLINNTRIKYMGYVTDDQLAELRRAALAVVMPNIATGGTDMEGFGLTALEACSDGGILLASRIDGIVDAVIDCVTGFLLPPEDAEAWAIKIREIAQWSKWERAIFIDKARIKIKQQYSWSRVAQNTVSIYESS